MTNFNSNNNNLGVISVMIRFYSTSGLPNNSKFIEDLCPAVRYSDADSEKVKILADNRKKAGVYL